MPLTFKLQLCWCCFAVAQPRREDLTLLSRTILQAQRQQVENQLAAFHALWTPLVAALKMGSAVRCGVALCITVCSSCSRVEQNLQGPAKPQLVLLLITGSIQRNRLVDTPGIKWVPHTPQWLTWLFLSEARLCSRPVLRESVFLGLPVWAVRVDTEGAAHFAVLVNGKVP